MHVGSHVSRYSCDAAIRIVVQQSSRQMKISNQNLNMTLFTPMTCTNCDKLRILSYMAYNFHSVPILTLTREEAAIRELLTVTNSTRTGGPAEGAHLHIVHLSDARSSLDLIKVFGFYFSCRYGCGFVTETHALLLVGSFLVIYAFLIQKSNLYI